MADTIYFDCPCNKDGEPVRADQFERLKASLCVYCGVLTHASECPEKWEEELSEYGLSRKDIVRANARAFLTKLENEEGDERESESTAFYRFRSSRERNFAKRDIPSWARNDGTLLVLMRNFDMSRKRGLQTFRAVYEKWRSKEKITATKKDHARMRKCLERLRKDAEALKQELIETDMTPKQVDAYFHDPTLKNLLYPEKVRIEQKIEEIDQKYPGGLDDFIGDGDWDSLTPQQKEAAEDRMRKFMLEGMTKALKGMKDHRPKDPSSKHLAEFLAICPSKSDTCE